MSDSGPVRAAPGRGLRWLPAAMLLVSLLMHLPTLDAPLVDRHPFRQTQTAFTARIFHEEGIDLLHPKLPILGAPWEVPFEFPAYQALASVVMDVGVPEDAALRSTGLASFLLAATLLWLLVRRQAGWLGATTALAIFLFSPLGISWGRAALIEYTALAACFGFALSGLRWRESRSGAWFALALALGCLATMVKITTALFWVAPFALLAVSRDDARGDRRSWLGAWELSILPILAGFAWTRHADAIKAASESTAWLTSSQLLSWNVGTLEQRLALDSWYPIANSAILLAGGIGLLFLAYPAIRFAFATRQLRFWAWIAVTAVGPVLVFFNLYYVHDYYAIAVSPSVAALVGLGIAGLPLVRTWLRALLLTGAAVTWAAVWFVQMPYWTRMYDATSDPEGVLPLAAQIARETSPDQYVAIIGRDWTPEVLYYADRWGYMLSAHVPPDVTIESLVEQGYVVYQCPWVDSADHCTLIASPALGVPVSDATFGPVSGRTGLLESRP